MAASLLRRRTHLGRLLVLPVPIALLETCRSRWPASQLTVAYTPDPANTGRLRATPFQPRTRTIAQIACRTPPRPPQAPSCLQRLANRGGWSPRVARGPASSSSRRSHGRAFSQLRRSFPRLAPSAEAVSSTKDFPDPVAVGRPSLRFARSVSCCRT